MKWEVSCFIKSEPDKKICLNQNSKMDAYDYECVASSAQEAIKTAQNYIIEQLKCESFFVEESDDRIIAYDSNQTKIIAEYYNFSPKRIYTLIGRDGKPYKSYEPGQFGGHKKLKIYGRLDCPSAARHIAKGEYVKYRVFFKDEETAIAAGYRPCAVCMKEEYQKWKMNQK